MDATLLAFQNYVFSISLTSIVTMLLIWCNFWILFKSRKAQQQDFILAEMLNDRDGKKSATRWGVLISIAASTWFLMYVGTSTMSDNTKLWVFAIYIGIWSGAKVVEKAIDAWTAVRGGTPVSLPTTTTETVVQTTTEIK